MSRLQRRAWIEVILVVICALILFVDFSFLVSRNVKGVGYFIIFLVVGAPILLGTALEQYRFEGRLDEREISMYRKAKMWSALVFVGYLCVFCFCVFFLIGGGGKVDVWYFPVMVFSGLLIAQVVQSGVILLWCDKEEGDE